MQLQPDIVSSRAQKVMVYNFVSDQLPYAEMLHSTNEGCSYANTIIRSLDLHCNALSALIVGHGLVPQLWRLYASSD